MNAEGKTPQRGDVLSVGYADPEKAARAAQAAKSADAVDQLVQAPTPDADERVAVRLYDYPFLFVVRLRGGRTGPVIRHLEITADDCQSIDYDDLRSFPLRRIALSAWRWLQRCGGAVGFPGDHALNLARPDNDPDADRLAEMIRLVLAAIRSGRPVRKTVADEMGIGTATLDRMIRRAKDAGLMDGIEIPKRPGPKQRDTTEKGSGQ